MSVPLNLPSGVKLLDPRGWRGKWELPASGLNLKHARRRSLWEDMHKRRGPKTEPGGILNTQRSRGG